MTRLPVVPSKSNAQGVMGQWSSVWQNLLEAFPLPTPFPDHRSINLTGRIRIYSTRYHCHFLLPSTTIFRLSNPTCTCSSFRLRSFTLFKNIQQATYTLLITCSIYTTLKTHLTHIFNTPQQNALLTRCRCPGWLRLCFKHPSSARESDQ